jgi:putative hydrolase of the HAD superfamily
MRKKAIILDLDNTIYSVHSLGHELFASLFNLILEDGNHQEEMDRIKEALLHRPFQVVAKEFGFSEELTKNGIAHLKDLTYRGRIRPFDDYEFVRNLSVDKFLVTTGFLKLQQSKVEGMRLHQDFDEIHIVDPSTSDLTKRDVFAHILQQHGYTKEEVVVVGDDLTSEIKAAQELGIDAVLYDHFQLYREQTNLPRIADFAQLSQFLV